MNPNNSPWLHQLKITRPIDTLYQDTKTDIAIVGGGISGVMTAYFTLKNTDKQVLLLEGSRIAHGSTGHNAGQVVATFEREFHDIVREHGLEKAADGERALHSAWILLDQIFQEANLHTPISSFAGYNGYAGIELLIDELKNNALRREAGISTTPIYIADHVRGLEKIPQEYRSLYELIPHKDILSLLETENAQYIAVVSQKTAAINSAMLVEELVGYLLNKYKGRFQLAEHTSVEEVILEKHMVLLKTRTNRKDGKEEKIFDVNCGKVILCTNGFERVRLINNAGRDVDTKFHQSLHGAIGYMSGYLEELNRQPAGLSYYDEQFLKSHKGGDAFSEAPYFYVTRRPFEIEKGERHNLVCIGGPELLIGDTRKYVREYQFDKKMGDKISDFVKQTYKKIPGEHFEYKFQWHGLLCYTPGGIRLIGPDPKNKNLMYNLGCNGIGIIPSIYGGMKISKMLAGEEFPPSIFDPKDL
ncbi:MAG: FAD-binding oxidoreductase [bacterium]